MIEAIIDALFTPGPVWIGTVTGIIIATCVWFLFPDISNKEIICSSVIALGFGGGWLYLALEVLKKRN